MLKAAIEFQSTLPVWGATQLDAICDADISISIHAPRVGSDMLTGYEPVFAS